jgi:hypothetical protein
MARREREGLVRGCINDAQGFVLVPQLVLEEGGGFCSKEILPQILITGNASPFSHLSKRKHPKEAL